MPREIDNGEGITWTCAEAYAGLGGGGGDAARVDGAEGELYRVICTPSGGARSVELELPAGWEDGVSDDDLLRQIEQKLGEQAPEG